MAVKATKSKIAKWKPKNADMLVEQDGKLFVCHFDKIFGVDKLSVYNRFIIRKDSYINQLPTIVHYTNFFLKFYDLDLELPTAYLKIKYALDKERLYDETSMDAYIDFLYEVMFRDTLVEKIYQLTEDNYIDDIDSSTEEKKKYLKSGEKKHLESLEFTNEHVKGLLRISFATKIMSPALFHYIQLNNIVIKKDSEIIFKFYERLFDIFKYSNTYDLFDNEEILIREHVTKEEFEKIISENECTIVGDGNDKRYYFTDPEDGVKKYICRGVMNLYNKLYVYVRTKILQSNANNSIIFGQREIFGQDIYTVINVFVKKVLISENLNKYRFPETWDPKLKQFKESIVGFNKTIIKFQLNYFLREQYSFNINEITNAKNTEGLSGSDKFAMNQNKLDEGNSILSDLNIKYTIARIRKIIDIPVTEEEIDYYAKNQSPSPIQIKLITSYYTKYFGSYNDLNLLTRRQYILLMLLLKKRLLLELGFSPDSDKIYHASLPYILTGNLSDKINTRIIRNNNFIAKIEENYAYHDLIYNRYRLLGSIKPEEILQLLSTVINSRFTYVTYEHPDLLGTEILYDEDRIGDELTYFLHTL